MKNQTANRPSITGINVIGEKVILREKKLEDVVHELDDIKHTLDKNTRGTASMSQDSVYSVHMADAGTDSYEREKGYHFMNRETDYYKHLTKALERIDDGTFGICNIC